MPKDCKQCACGDCSKCQGCMKKCMCQTGEPEVCADVCRSGQHRGHMRGYFARGKEETCNDKSDKCQTCVEVYSCDACKRNGNCRGHHNRRGFRGYLSGSRGAYQLPGKNPLGGVNVSYNPAFGAYVDIIDRLPPWVPIPDLEPNKTITYPVSQCLSSGGVVALTADGKTYCKISNPSSGPDLVKTAAIGLAVLAGLMVVSKAL